MAENVTKKCGLCGVTYISNDGKPWNTHNIEVHEKSCTEKNNNNEKKKKKKRSSTNTNSLFSYYKPKKVLIPDDIGEEANVNIDVSIPDVVIPHVEVRKEIDIQTDDALIHDEVSQGASVSIRSENGDISIADTIISDNDDDVLVIKASDNVNKYCLGWQPPGISDLFEQFPFQLLPAMKTVVFSNNSFHHVECMQNNYMLQNVAVDDELNQVNVVCLSLNANSNVKSIMNRSTEPFNQLATYNNRFLNHRQLSNKCTSYRKELQKSQLDNMNMHRKLNRLGSTLDMHQRFLLCISQNNIPRLQQLVSVAVRNKRSIQYIVDKVLNAIDGLYLARPSHDDKELAYLILQFGGPALVDICHRANFLPSSSTAYRMAKELKKLDSNISYSAQMCMEKNTSLNKDNSTYGYSIKADETYVNPHVRYDSKYDEIKGVCYQHGSEFRSFSSYEEAEKLAEAVKNSEVHVPKECLVISGCSMNKTSPSDIILAWPTCDKQDFQGTYDHFESLSDKYLEMTGKPLMNFATDGDGTRRQVFNSLLNKTLDESTPVGEIICSLPLVDLLCGSHQETVSYDPKHLVKRSWTSFIKESVCIDNITIKKSDLKDLFCLLPKSNDLEIDGLLNPTDKQNVPAATKFLLYFIEAVRDTPMKDFPYRLVSIREHIIFLSNVFEGLLCFYTDKTISIKKQITRFSEACYSLFYLRSKHTRVIPNQLYHDLQSTFIDALFCCAKAQVYFPNELLFLVLGGTDALERIFGVLRMKNSNASMDYLMLLHCINSMVKCDEILTMSHPEWSKKGRSSRRLCLDYSSPRDWDEDQLKLCEVDIKALWECGHMKARAKALEIGIISSNESIDTLVLLGRTLKKPLGKLIGVTDVEIDISVEEEVDSVDEEESAVSENLVPFADLIGGDKCPTIDVDGKNIYKATVVNQLFSRHKLSKDRLRRVQGLTSGTPGDAKQVDDNNLIFIGDPLVIYAEQHPTIANIINIKLAKQNKKFVTVDELQLKNLIFHVQPLDLTEHEGNYYWNGSFTGDIKIISADKCVVIKPTISANPPEGMTNFCYDKQLLLDIGVQLTLSTASSTSAVPSTSKSKSNAEVFKLHKCHMCHKNIRNDKMRGHIGFHILSGTVESDACGFCGLPSCLNKFLNKSKVQIDSHCDYFYPYKKRPTYSKREKCTNYLAKCEAKNCGAAIWKYNMEKHYQIKHELLNVPEEFLVTENEKHTIWYYNN